MECQLSFRHIFSQTFGRGENDPKIPGPKHKPKGYADILPYPAADVSLDSRSMSAYEVGPTGRYIGRLSDNDIILAANIAGITAGAAEGRTGRDILAAGTKTSVVFDILAKKMAAMVNTISNPIRIMVRLMISV